MNKPRLLDLFCGAGGAAMGYSRAGFDVVGVDNIPQPHYPFEFIQAEALDYLDNNWWMFDAFHASPPCQRYSNLNNLRADNRGNYPDLIEPVRGYFEDVLQPGPYWKPWVIENVNGAPLNTQIVLCGAMFGLRVYRHRKFESNLLLFQPTHPKHSNRSSYGYKPNADEFYCISGHFADFIGASQAMGIEWMTSNHELSEAIPPAYTEYIGNQLIKAVK